MSLVTPQLGEAAVVVPRQPKEMVSVGERNGKRLVRINYSSMDVIQNCLRKAQYSLYEKWKPQDESVAIIFGSAFHKALEVFYQGDPATRVLPKLDTMELMAYDNLVPKEEEDLLLRSTRAFVKAAEPLGALPELDKHSIVNGVWILHCYFKTFIDDPYVALVDERGPFVERTFTLPIYEDGDLIVESFGTIDVGLQHIKTGEKLPADHKTVGFLGFGGSSYFDREKPNHQYTLYLMGAREVFGFDTNNFMVNIIEKKARPKTAGAKGVSFPRQITTRNEDDFADLKTSLVYVARQYLDAIDTGVWPQGPVGSCTAYGSCSFRQVCSVPKSMRETVLSAKFIKEVNDVVI